MDYLQASILKTKPKRAIRSEPREFAFYPPFLTHMNAQRRPLGMRSGSPAGKQLRQSLATPAFDFPGKRCREIARETIPIRRRTELPQRNDLLTHDNRSLGDVYANSDDYRISDPLKQDAGKFPSGQKQIVGPFEFQPGRDQHVAQYRFIDRQPNREGKALRRRLPSIEMDNGRAHEVSFARRPGPALPPTPGILPVGHQPMAFRNRLPRAQARG